MLDKVYGTLVCILVIFYYQTDVVESMSTITSGDEVKKEKLNLENLDTNTPSIDTKIQFRNTYCDKGHLTYKGQHVNHDVAKHIFPEIEWNNERCNICDPTCDFDIMEQKITTELGMKPENTRNI